MLLFIGSRRQTYVLRHMQRDERMPHWVCRTYGWLFRTWRLPPATYIFAGIDRLDANERRLAAQFYRHINAQGPGFRALNDPAVAMGRYRLLRTLHEQGINNFNAYLATERDRPQRYPVFVRRHANSLPPLTGLLGSPDALEAALAKLIAAGEPAEDLLIIEYRAEEESPGLYVKHAEYRIDGHYVLNAPLFGAGWYVKRASHIDQPDERHRADAALLADNPFAPTLRRAFEIAGIEYGRADFGLVGGRPQIYEINFNPELTTQREKPWSNPLHRANREHAEDRVFAALRDIDSAGGRPAPTLWTSELNQFRLRFWRNYAPQRY